MWRVAPTRLRCRQRGASLLETAIMMVVIFTVLFWIFELCWLMYTYSVIADAANEGVRYAIVHSGGDVSGTQSRVAAFAGATMHDVSAISTTVEFSADGGTSYSSSTSASPPNLVRVKVSYTYVPFLPNFIAAPTMHAYAEGTMAVQ
jgi:Flp pilus assembly protein TadG